MKWCWQDHFRIIPKECQEIFPKQHSWAGRNIGVCRCAHWFAMSGNSEPARQIPICRTGREGIQGCSGIAYRKICTIKRTDWRNGNGWRKISSTGVPEGGKEKTQAAAAGLGMAGAGKWGAAGSADSGVCPPGFRGTAHGRPLGPDRVRYGLGKVNWCLKFSNTLRFHRRGGYYPPETIRFLSISGECACDPCGKVAGG